MQVIQLAPKKNRYNQHTPFIIWWNKLKRTWLCLGEIYDQNNDIIIVRLWKLCPLLLFCYFIIILFCAHSTLRWSRPIHPLHHTNSVEKWHSMVVVSIATFHQLLSRVEKSELSPLHLPPITPRSFIHYKVSHGHGNLQTSSIRELNKTKYFVL